MKASNFIAVFASAILSSASPVPEEQGLGSYSPPADTPSDPTAPTWGSYTGGSGSGSGFGDIGGLGPEVPANGGSIFSPFPGGLPVGGAPQGYTGNTWPPKEYPADSPFSNGGFDKAADLCSNENSIDNAAISCCSQSGLPVIGGIIGGISGLGCTLNIRTLILLYSMIISIY